jgi:hypothetical protein
MHRPKVTTGARARATTPNGLDRLNRVGVDIRLNRDSGDSDVAADVNPDKLTGTGQPVDIPWFDAQPVGYLGNGEQLTGLFHHRPPSRSGRVVID